MLTTEQILESYIHCTTTIGFDDYFVRGDLTDLAAELIITKNDPLHLAHFTRHLAALTPLFPGTIPLPHLPILTLTPHN